MILERCGVVEIWIGRRGFGREVCWVRLRECCDLEILKKSCLSYVLEKSDWILVEGIFEIL